MGRGLWWGFGGSGGMPLDPDLHLRCEQEGDESIVFELCSLGGV